MKAIKRWTGMLLALAMLAAGLSAGAEEPPENAAAPAAESGSWSQINQSLARGEDWVRIVSLPGEFQLGEARPLEGSPDLMIADWGSYPSMDGSTVCVPLAMELARQWLDLQEEDLNGFVNFSTTPVAYERLTEGKANPMVTIVSRKTMMDDAHPVDLVLGTGPNADERAAAEKAGKELVMVPFCCDAFVFLVNSENPVRSLTVDQIRRIYSGRIKLWSDVGGDEKSTIAPYQRPHGSGSQTAMEELVMGNWPLIGTGMYISDGMSDLIAQIGNYDNARNAIGYSYLYYVEGLYKSGSIRVLDVDGVSPSPENMRSGAYPFTVNYYAVYEKGNETAARFADWLISDEGQACVAQAGYVSLR